MNSYLFLLYLIIFVKLCFALSLLIQVSSYFDLKFISEEFYEANEHNKERFENLYFFLMSLMLLSLFKNRSKHSYKFSKLELELLFLFGIVLFIKMFADWLKKYRETKSSGNKFADIADAIIEFVIPSLKTIKVII
tara:strand:+ start:733 stop:1140 length:408 start_codon:yes stop_codon:yes gene_type:complete